jgi:AraC-like DNA-binding protein
MADLIEKTFDTYFSQIGLCQSVENRLPFGKTYEPEPGVGKGWYWLFPIDGTCAVSLLHMTLQQDVSLRLLHPPFLYFGMMEGDLPCEVYDYPGGMAGDGYVGGYAGDLGESRMCLPMGHCVSCVGITLTREFCKERMGSNVAGGGGFNRLKRGLAGLSASSVLPEMRGVFRQLRSFRPARSAARMYYESKAMEVVAYVLHGQSSTHDPSGPPIPAQDVALLRRVEQHLHDNPRSPATGRELAAMACMSRTKLAALFRRVHGRSITEYLQSVRLERAKRLLAESDLKIEAVAAEVGYQRHGSFSESFKRATGLTPRQFRRDASMASY